LKKALHVWLVGHAGCYNRGCEAIVRSTTALLDERFGPCRYTLWSNDSANDSAVFDGGPIRVVDGHKSPGTLDRRRISRKLGRLPGGCLGRRILQRLPGWPSCALSIGGDNFTLDYGAPKSFVSAGMLLMDAGIPLVIWGASVGPFSADARVEAQMAEFLAKVDLITVRESRSINYLRSLGIERNVRRVFDPAFALDAEPYDGPEAGFVGSGNVVGLNISALIARWFPGKDLEAMLGEVAGFVDAILGEGFKVLLVPHVTAENDASHRNDEEILRRLLTRIEGNRQEVALLPGNLSAGQLKGVISRCRFFIGARTHSTIAAYSSGVPTIAIGYSQKARGICRDLFGHEAYLVPTDRLTTASLRGAWKAIRRDEDIIRNVLREKRPEMIEGARRNAEALEELLRGGLRGNGAR
jgi:colanic acid/amylovoran biosynthesis protein